jgi:hypothetical protein
MLTRDESREEIGYDPIDNAPVWFSDVAAPASGFLGASPNSLGAPGAPTGEPAQIVADESNRGEPADLLAQEAEAKQFRTFAATRIKEGHPDKVSSFKFKCLPMSTAMQLITEALPASDTGSPFPEWDEYG